MDDPKQENVHTSEVVMDMKHTRSILRLIYEIYPPLPSEGKHWDMKNELFQWQKTGLKVEEVKIVCYWSDDMTKMAIYSSNVTLDVPGSYSFTYSDVLDTINEKETTKSTDAPC